ncbi:unnamed protein product [Malassezia sympodialis ATCC 42132]|uniref:uncharacterized protein n=1 Tax=Malassezia sympodialis (strain ATCC 42132) TaxID=1230383 RepID=UPI0002C245D7|nr:uncharacterized protein MSY001_0588 [Malassezia sympodialis ATCC 42132]CCU97882.1 unnamed protein product [Malassezia sympodialis ATCC 42132]|eukprot:XP_018739210.1 uncharacterized protein MSY001_0588 [Malassezia sympodialis ATCC 42132]
MRPMHIASVGVPRLSAYVARAVARPSVATASRCAPVTGMRAFSFARACHRDTAWLDRGRMTYEELKPYTEAPSGKITLIDVREPNEVAQGMIPAAVNVPLSEFGSAFNPNSYSENANDFERKFSFPRPSFDDPIVFYCRSGKRSQQALETARERGWWKYVPVY